MAVFRIAQTKDYVTMSNRHFKNKNLSLIAKGLLSQTLSLPEEWYFTLKGLAHINKESVDAVRTATWRPEKEGYVVRRQVQNQTAKWAKRTIRFLKFCKNSQIRICQDWIYRYWKIRRNKI